MQQLLLVARQEQAQPAQQLQFQKTLQLRQEKHRRAEHPTDKHQMDKRLMDRHQMARLLATHRKAEHLTARHRAILPEADSAAEAAVQT